MTLKRRRLGVFTTSER